MATVYRQSPSYVHPHLYINPPSTLTCKHNFLTHTLEPFHLSNSKSNPFNPIYIAPQPTLSIPNSPNSKRFRKLSDLMDMKQIRGFRIRLKPVKAIKWVVQERRTDCGYSSNLKPTNCTVKAIARVWKLGRRLKRGLKELCFSKSGSDYARIGAGISGDKKPVPRGHLAVYFGEEEDDAHRVLVPVIYFNHPFFGDLLREAEKVYGFDHRGGIHVPCRISEFENVQTRIFAAGGGGGRSGGHGRSWRSWL